MNILVTILSVCVFLYTSSSVDAVSASRIRDKARKYLGSTKWSFASSHSTGTNTNKCNIFVADVISEAGGSVPRRWFGLGGVIGAGEWGNPASNYLSRDRCWNNENSCRVGDVIGDRVHVGIVTGASLTTSASATEQKVVENDFGFRTRQSPMTCWRYVC